jgi:hypothetical protein
VGTVEASETIIPEATILEIRSVPVNRVHIGQGLGPGIRKSKLQAFAKPVVRTDLQRVAVGGCSIIAQVDGLIPLDRLYAVITLRLPLAETDDLTG